MPSAEPRYAFAHVTDRGSSMADGQQSESAFARRPGFLWTEIFRSFWVALDPRKLLVAAAGILAVALGWYFLSYAAYGMATKPDREQTAYSNESIAKSLGKKADGTDHSPETLATEGTKRFNSDLATWSTLDDLAGPHGRLRTMPWNEYRGQNPYLFSTKLVGGSSVERSDAISDFLKTQVPVLLEPLSKLLLPIVKITEPNTGFGTRIYCLLCLFWSLAVWAFCGGVITRIAAVQLSGKDRISLSQAVTFVWNRYVAYVLSPILPIGVVAAIVVALILFGLLGLIPLIGDVLILAVLFPLVILAGLVMAVILVGLVGYPLMYTTLSVEGSDTFDALSRAYNYVFQAPWRFLFYSAIAVVYGMAVTFFVVFMGSLTVYLGKWGANQTASAIYSTHTPDYLFVNAPKTLGWRELLLKGSDIEVVDNVETLPNGRRVIALNYKDPPSAEKYVGSYWGYHHFASWIVTFWLMLILLMLLGFGYSYFWSAATTIYLLMRKAVDDTEMDEIYLEDDASDQPLPPPISIPMPPSQTGTTLPMVPPTPPAAPPPTPPVDGPTL